ncbi:hypothetical protein [Myroides sp. N17-2]|uniref:hypothetical protein n=1 Tax=Myroides sp. N17-2 TaxID=2030799 RepID=UPI000EFD0671|nr:hypothetical protein [Myroides sp. N17-2]
MEKVKETFVFKGDQYEDLDYAIEDFVNEYDLPLDPKRLAIVKNVAEMIELLVSTFKQERKEGCTSQQAFYKLRTVLQKYTNESDIKPSTRLEELFPKQNRIENIKRVEEELGIKLSILKPKDSVAAMFVVTFLGLFALLFFATLYAMVGGVIWSFAYKVTKDYGKEFKVDTGGELVKRMIEKNYFKSRRDPNTMNEQEFRDVIIDYLVDKVGLEREEFLNAKFG